jgi:hypothetical protein
MSDNIEHYLSILALRLETMIDGNNDRYSEIRRPSRTFLPKVFLDGDQWCALYGDNIQEGVAGFGVTPAAACDDFDLNWRTQSSLILKDADK